IRFIDGDLLVTCNGITDRVDLNGESKVVLLNAGGGNDRVTVQGTSAAETARLDRQSLDWRGPQVRILGEGIEWITLKGGGGDDRAELFDSPGDDAYV